MMNREMAREDEEGAGTNVILWENGLRFILRALADEAEEVWEWIKDDDEQKRLDRIAETGES